MDLRNKDDQVNSYISKVSSDVVINVLWKYLQPDQIDKFCSLDAHCRTLVRENLSTYLKLHHIDNKDSREDIAGVAKYGSKVVFSLFYELHRNCIILPWNYTQICLALSKYGHRELLHYFLNSITNPTIKCKMLITATIKSSFYGHIEIVQDLFSIINTYSDLDFKDTPILDSHDTIDGKCSPIPIHTKIEDKLQLIINHIFIQAADGGHLDILQWCHQKGATYFRRALSKAILKSHVCNSYECSYNCCKCIKIRGVNSAQHLAVLTYLTNNYNYSHDDLVTIIWSAINCDWFEALQLLISQKCFNVSKYDFKWALFKVYSDIRIFQLLSGFIKLTTQDYDLLFYDKACIEEFRDLLYPLCSRSDQFHREALVSTTNIGTIKFLISKYTYQTKDFFLVALRACQYSNLETLKHILTMPGFLFNSGDYEALLEYSLRSKNLAIIDYIIRNHYNSPDVSLIQMIDKLRSKTILNYHQIEIDNNSDSDYDNDDYYDDDSDYDDSDISDDGFEEGTDTFDGNLNIPK